MQANERLESNEMLLRVLIYGMQKTRKTWWAMKAAEAGYNVILIDGDDGWHIVNKIDPSASERIEIVNMVDKPNASVFAPMLTKMLKMSNFRYDEIQRKLAGLNQVENCIKIDVTKLTKNDVFVLDSWTALVWSLTLRYAEMENIDLDDLSGQDWDFYRWGGNLANWILGKLKTLPCHVIVIGHMTVYEKFRGTKKNRKLVLQREQVSSVSGPHGLKLGINFSDVLRFNRKSNGDTIILAQGNNEAEGGSRIVKPGTYDWDKLQFIDICKMAGIKPDENAPKNNFKCNQEENANVKNEINKPKTIKTQIKKTATIKL